MHDVRFLRPDAVFILRLFFRSLRVRVLDEVDDRLPLVVASIRPDQLTLPGIKYCSSAMLCLQAQGL